MRPDVATLRRLLRYEPETGKFFWRPRTAADFVEGGHTAEHNAAKWNGQYADQEAFATPSGNYLAGGVLGHQCGAHQLAWAMFHGEWPVGPIDHEDHDGTNNRIGNLRDVTPAINSKNQSLRRTNQSGVTGVHLRAAQKRWVAKIHVNGRTIHIGNFAEFDDAARARRAAEREHGFHPNHGKRTA